MRLILALGNKTMTEKFWFNIYDTIGMHKMGALQSQVNLMHILQYDALNHIEAIESISNQARGEDAILSTMKGVIAHWDNCDFTVANYRDSKDRFIIKQVEDVITLIEDDSMIVGTCMGSKYVVNPITEGLRDTVELWERKLGYITDLIDEWTKFQRTWMYLENIFNAADIQAQLKAETKKFQAVDKFWKDFMQKLKKEKGANVMSFFDNGTHLKKF